MMVQNGLHLINHALMYHDNNSTANAYFGNMVFMLVVILYNAHLHFVRFTIISI